MRNPTRVPPPSIDTTVHAMARNLAKRVAGTALGEIANFQSVQEQVEFFTILRDWGASNLANIEQLAAAGIHFCCIRHI
jgi:hypothetical protein